MSIIPVLGRLTYNAFVPTTRVKVWTSSSCAGGNTSWQLGSNFIRANCTFEEIDTTGNTETTYHRITNNDMFMCERFSCSVMMVSGVGWGLLATTARFESTGTPLGSTVNVLGRIQLQGPLGQGFEWLVGLFSVLWMTVHTRALFQKNQELWSDLLEPYARARDDSDIHHSWSQGRLYVVSPPSQDFLFFLSENPKTGEFSLNPVTL